MSAAIDVQCATDAAVPATERLQAWARAALEDAGRHEVVLRLVDEAESRELNASYRGRDRPTNVLSFPFEQPPGMTLPHLGDLAICAPVVAREAREQGKAAEAHWAHMVVHGILHLRGFDHVDTAEAEVMEENERRILARLGFPDPYLVGD